MAGLAVFMRMFNKWYCSKKGVIGVFLKKYSTRCVYTFPVESQRHCGSKKITRKQWF